MAGRREHEVNNDFDMRFSGIGGVLGRVTRLGILGCSIDGIALGTATLIGLQVGLKSAFVVTIKVFAIVTGCEHSRYAMFMVIHNA